MGRAAIPANAGARNATLGEIIAAGLAALAPATWEMPSTPPGRLQALHASLFDGTAAEDRLPSAVIAAAYAEVVRLHQRRMDTRPDESLDEYRKWHRGGGTNVPKLILKAIQKAGWDEGLARRALAELSWRSVRSTASAVSAAMSVWLEKARGAAKGPEPIVPKLSLREVSLFKSMYVGVRETCGLPLAVLYERLDVLEPWLAAATTAPGKGKTSWGGFYAALGTYAFVACQRREVDRDKKRKQKIRTAAVAIGTKRSSTARSAPGGTHSQPRESNRQGAAPPDAAAIVRARIAAETQCKWGKRNWSVTNARPGTTIEFNLQCVVCKRKKLVRRTAQQISELYRSIAG